MRILIDECVPRRFISVFSDYEAVSVSYMGWSGKKNGELLKLMTDAKFNVFITVDQNLQNTQVSFLVLQAATNSYRDLLVLVPAIHATLAAIEPGRIYAIK